MYIPWCVTLSVRQRGSLGLRLRESEPWKGLENLGAFESTFVRTLKLAKVQPFVWCRRTEKLVYSYKLWKRWSRPLLQLSKLSSSCFCFALFPFKVFREENLNQVTVNQQVLFLMSLSCWWIVETVYFVCLFVKTNLQNSSVWSFHYLCIWTLQTTWLSSWCFKVEWKEVLAEFPVHF